MSKSMFEYDLLGMDASTLSLPRSGRNKIVETNLEKHLARRCHPCVAFAIRPTGCFKGDACSHCHFCTAEEAKQRRREIQIEAKERKKEKKNLMPVVVSSTFWI